MNYSAFKRPSHKSGYKLIKNSPSDDHIIAQNNRVKEKIQRINDIEKNIRSIPPVFLDISDIEIDYFYAGIEQSAPCVEEVSNNFITVSVPRFRCEATVEIPPLPEGTSIQLGFIQMLVKTKHACLHQNDELLSWQVPKLVNGETKMVIDSDANLYPWCRVDEGLFSLQGPTQYPYSATVRAHDIPSNRIGLCLPKSLRNTKPTLKFVYRNNTFCTYLVLKNFKEDRYQIIKAVKWSIEVAVEIDVTKPLGKRVVFVGPCLPKPTEVLKQEEIPPFETKYLEGPCANECQMLIGKYRGKDPFVFKEPEKETVNLNDFLYNIKDYNMKLLKITKSNYCLKEEMLNSEVLEN